MSSLNKNRYDALKKFEAKKEISSEEIQDLISAGMMQGSQSTLNVEITQEGKKYVQWIDMLVG